MFAKTVRQNHVALKQATKWTHLFFFHQKLSSSFEFQSQKLWERERESGRASQREKERRGRDWMQLAAFCSLPVDIVMQSSKRKSYIDAIWCGHSVWLWNCDALTSASRAHSSRSLAGWERKTTRSAEKRARAGATETERAGTAMRFAF